MSQLENDLISVIIPVYNTEKFLRKCLDSVINQTYKNLEIICVNDASPDKSKEILEEYKKKDNRIKVITHDKNKGLFRARVSGLLVAKGDYIGIVDSDDYISKDYYRKLIETAKEKNSDIVMGKIIHENSDAYQYVHNSYFNMQNIERRGRDVLDKYLEQEGLCFIWHTVWNKLYSKKVWEQALPFLQTIEDNIIMCEDVLFSTIIHTYAQSIVSTDFAYYFYMQHSGASTANNDNFSKFKRNITALIKVFNIVETFLNNRNVSNKNKEHFQNWKKLYSRFWYDNVNNASLDGSNKRLLFNILREGLNLKELEKSTLSDNYFYKLTTPWDSRYEQLINQVLNDEVSTISLDIFDTIIVRPFLNPTDLFLTLDDLFDQINPNSVLTNFSDIRILAERECRQNLYKSEEVTLDEIYNYINNKFHISNEICEKMKQAEIDAELKYCKPRKSIVNIINLAKHLNKKVICTSDFYMDKDILKQMLNKINVQVDEIYVSCEYGLTKHTGSLYQKVISLLNVDPDSVLHIGDNWQSDYINAKANKLKAIFYPSCKNSFMYEISDIKTSDVTALYKRPSGMWINYEKSLKFFEVRCAIALCANKLYDNPYYPYHEGTSFNGDSNFIGYYALGMHLWSITKWLYQNNLNKKGKIHFIARDGYLPKLAYDIVNKNNEARESNYIYVSRKSLMPLAILDENNFYSVGTITTLNNLTPNKLLSLFKPILNAEKYTSLIKNATDKPFKSENTAYEFINKYLIDAYDEDTAKNYRQKIFKYFNNIISNGDVSFDIGYSGRTQLLLSNLLRFPINSYFIHANDDQFTRKHKHNNIEINSLYNYTPSITGSIREFSISELAPSCIGYDLDNNSPIFEDFDVSYSCKYSIESLQDMALEFIKDMNKTFGIREDFTARPMDLSMPYEYLLHHTPWEDTNYFSACEFEDDLYEGKSKTNLSNIWQRDMAYHHALTYPYSNTVSQPSIDYHSNYYKFYDKINKLFPIGSKRRKFAKKIGKLFIRK